jgi:hypothetical protein
VSWLTTGLVLKATKTVVLFDLPAPFLKAGNAVNGLVVGLLQVLEDLVKTD